MKNFIDPRDRTGGAPRARLDSEGGFLLVLVMIVMLVLSTIAASSLINSFLERSLAKNQNYTSVSLQSAEAGLGTGMTWIRENKASIPDHIATPGWTKTIDGTLASGGSYTVTMRFKTEWRDVNGDGDCLDAGESSGYQDIDGSPATSCPGEIVLYNKCKDANGCFNFPDSLYANANEGAPVIEIDAKGYYGADPAKASSFREIALDVARNKVDIQAEGAVTVRGQIDVTGNSNYIDGHNFTADGTALKAGAGDCSNKPSITVDTGIAQPVCTGADGEEADKNNPKGRYGGTPCTATHDDATGDLGPLPWDLLGIEKEDFEDIFTPTTLNGAKLALSGDAGDPAYVWVTDYTAMNGNDTGVGILVVHNPDFDPDSWEANVGNYRTVDANGDGKADHAPARLDLGGNITYTGVIIADQIVKATGSVEVIGAMMSVGGASITADYSGNFTAKYSCDAIDLALGGFGYGTKIAWHRLR